VLAVAILPMLGSAGCRFIAPKCRSHEGQQVDAADRADGQIAVGGVRQGLLPRASVCLRFAGMNWFDAVCHGFSALALGGFSSYDASIGHFNSLPIEMSLTVFQIFWAACVISRTHYLAWSQRGVQGLIFCTPKAKAVLGVLAASCVGIALFWSQGQRSDSSTALRHTTFNLVSSPNRQPALPYRGLPRSGGPISCPCGWMS